MEFEVLQCSRKRILKRHIWRRKEGRQDIALFGACFELYTYLNLKCRWNSLLHFCIRLKLNQKGASTAINRSIAVNAIVTLTTFMPKIAQNCNLTAVIRSIKSMPDTAIINWTMWALWWSISKRDVSAIKMFVVPRSNLKNKVCGKLFKVFRCKCWGDRSEKVEIEKLYINPRSSLKNVPAGTC